MSTLPAAERRRNVAHDQLHYPVARTEVRKVECDERRGEVMIGLAGRGVRPATVAIASDLAYSTIVARRHRLSAASTEDLLAARVRVLTRHSKALRLYLCEGVPPDGVPMPARETIIQVAMREVVEEDGYTCVPGSSVSSVGVPADCSILLKVLTLWGSQANCD